MKRHMVRMVAGLAFAALQVNALELTAPPSPAENQERAKYSIARDDKEWENVFSGHYGEILHLPAKWTAEAVLRGPMEIVYMREKTLPPPSERPSSVELLKDGGANVTFHEPLFQIKPKEFIPENFARLRLMQLLVIPKNAPGGFRSLEKLREAKSKELSATGSPYKLQQADDHPWPPDSFWVSISTPYRLFQFYTQSDKNFLIFTSGASPAPYDERLDDPSLRQATQKIIRSLMTHLSDYAREIAEQKDLKKDLSIALLPWAAVCFLAAALSFLPKRRNWLRRLRLIGRTTFGFTSALHLIAGPALFAAWRLGLDRAINDASILFCAGILMPWLCKAVSVRLAGQRSWRVFVWSAITNILPVATGLVVMRDFISGAASITGYQNFWTMSFTLSTVGLLNGVVFGLAHQTGAEDKSTGGAR